MKALQLVTLFCAVTFAACGGGLPNHCEDNPALCIDTVIQTLEQVCSELEPDAGIAECVSDIIEANK
jgi:hypothetical protein